MEGNKKYNINIFGLKSGVHKFSFEYSSELFSIDEFSLVDEGQGVCNLELEKSDTLISLNFSIIGKVQLTCDRTLDKFDYKIELNNKLILKYGDDFDDIDDEIWIIQDNLQVFNIERNIFEFINVSIPLKRLHPRFGNEDLDELSLVYSSEKEDCIEESEEVVDPRWAALKNLKNSK